MIGFTIKIAGRVFNFKSDSPLLSYDVSKAVDFKRFIYRGSQKPDFVFTIRYGYVPKFSGRNIQFSVENKRILSLRKGGLIFEYPAGALAGSIKMASVIKPNMREGIIYVKAERPSGKKEKELMVAQNIFRQIKTNFFMPFLSDYIIRSRLGFMAHSSSVYNDNKLYLFMGRKESGKSTIAEIWNRRTGARIFNDDRAIITTRNNTAYFYNMPWIGTAERILSRCRGDATRIDNIFFIFKNSRNTLKRLKRTEAASRIFLNTFPVFWEKASLTYVLDICSEIAGRVPCYELGFVKDDSTVDFLKRQLRRHEK